MELSSSFDVVVAGDDGEVAATGLHKPHPFPYLHAAEKLGVTPELCVAFEDSLAGVSSAQV